MADQSNAESSSSSEEPPPTRLEPLKLPNFEEMKAQDVFNNCAVRSVVSGVMGTPYQILQVKAMYRASLEGGGMGIFMGMLFGALDNPINAEQMTARQHFVHAAKQMGSRSLHMAKAFAIMGSIFSLTECVVEKARAKHDMANTMTAGCVTGGALSAKAGPKATCIGCAGFAAFSVVIEKLFDRTT